MRADKDALRAVGRITLGDAAQELGDKTGWGKDRWWLVLYRWVGPHLEHRLMRRNPRNLDDLLPFDPPALPEYDDHVFIVDVNRLLDEYPEWGTARLTAPAADKTRQRDPRKWSPQKLRVLRTEYQNGATQGKLAEKYKLTRQRISALLKKAGELDRRGPPSLAETGRIRKVRGRFGS